MTGQPKSPPARMRNYRIEAQPRETPDLHKLSQLFVSMALSRAEQDRARRSGADGAGSVGGSEVESETQEANG